MTETPAGKLKHDPKRTGLFLDFDGTLSEIVDHPDAARPVAGARDLLTFLAQRYALVSVVSGRSAHQLLDWLGSDLEIWGLHGAERTHKGSVVVAPEARQYADVMRAAAEDAREELTDEGVEVEDKRVMLGLHYRRASDPETARTHVEATAAKIAEAHGLWIGTGRMVVELRPPLEFTKAAVVRRRVEELSLEAAAFAGDDVVDLPAFDALDELKSRGVRGVKIAVASSEAPSELLERADVVVEGPAGVIEFLRALIA